MFPNVKFQLLPWRLGLPLDPLSVEKWRRLDQKDRSKSFSTSIVSKSWSKFFPGFDFLDSTRATSRPGKCVSLYIASRTSRPQLSLQNLFWKAPVRLRAKVSSYFRTRKDNPFLTIRAPGFETPFSSPFFKTRRPLSLKTTWARALSRFFFPLPTSSKPLLGRPSVFRLQKYEEVLLENHSVVVVVVQQPTSFSSSFSSRHEFTQTSRNLPTPMSSIGGGFSFLFLVCFPRKRLYLISD